MKQTVKILSLMFGLMLFIFSPINAQTVEELIAQGDDFSTKKFDNEKALAKFIEADKLSPNNWEILWRLSRSYVDISEHMPSSTDAQKDAQLVKYQMAYDYADKSVKLAPDKSITYLRRAIANGRIALFKGVFSVIGIVNDVKKDLEKAIKLGNGGSEVQASSYYVLARTHAKVCEKAYLVRMPLGLGWGDMDESFKNFKKAIELRPNFRMYYLDAGKAYIQEKEYAKAKEMLSKIPSLPVLDEDDAQFLADSKKLLEEIKNK
jgi:tetratricopeptide (TPR) repeat protein